MAAGADVNSIASYRDYFSGRLVEYPCLHSAVYCKNENNVAILIAAGAGVDERAHTLLLKANMTAPSEQVLRKERKLIERVRWNLVLPRVLEICIALHTLQISVLEMIEVLEFAVPVFYLLTAHNQWRMVMFIRHWTVESIAAADVSDAAAEEEEEKRRKRRRKRIGFGIGIY